MFALARESQFGRFSVVAFSMEERRVFYRQPEGRRIDFPALGKAVSKLKSGTIDYGILQDPDGATNSLTALLTVQLGPQQPVPDAIVIVSPKVMLDKNPTRNQLADAGSAECPVFYMNYNTDPAGNPWRNAIGAAIKAYRGIEYSISAPRELGKAMGQMMRQLRASH